MYAVTIDTDLCKKDGLCAKVCPKGIFVQREKLTIPLLDASNVVLIPFELGYLLYQGKQSDGELSLRVCENIPVGRVMGKERMEPAELPG